MKLLESYREFCWIESMGPTCKEEERWNNRFNLLRWMWHGVTFWFACLYCSRIGHDIEDCSSAGPESGNMDHYCKRCGQYWSHQLY